MHIQAFVPVRSVALVPDALHPTGIAKVRSFMALRVRPSPATRSCIRYRDVTMIRFILCLFGLLFIQAAIMGQMQPKSGDVFTSFGDGLRAAVAYDTGLVQNVEGLFTGSAAPSVR